jgi:hypothetical protein
VKTRRVATISVLVFFCGAICLASDDEGEIFVADLDGFQLSLDGADHYYWLTPEKGRVVLNKACVPIDEDCDHDVVAVWDDNGEKIFERAPFLDIPEMTDGRIFDSTLAAPDRLIVSAMAGEKNFTHVLAEYDIRNGELKRVIRTGSIRCRNVLGIQDGAVWCVGTDIDKRKRGEDYDLVYRVDETGTLIESLLSRSLFPETPGPLAVLKRPDGYGGFLPGNGPVRLWLPAVNELITFDSQGRVVNRLAVAAVEHLIQARLVTAPDGEVYAILTTGKDTRDSDTWTHCLYRLTHTGATWTPLADSPSRLPIRMTLVGADEEGLILLDRRSLELLWHPIPPSSATAEMADASTTSYDE